MLNVVVKRSEWLRGENRSNSYLLRSDDGKMCCLGFVARTLGATAQDIMDRRTPMTVDSIEWPDPQYNQRIIEQFSATVQMMDINDAQTMDETEREQRLSALAEAIGIHFTFTE